MNLNQNAAILVQRNWSQNVCSKITSGLFSKWLKCASSHIHNLMFTFRSVRYSLQSGNHPGVSTRFLFVQLFYFQTINTNELWILLTKGQWCGKRFFAITPSYTWYNNPSDDSPLLYMTSLLVYLIIVSFLRVVRVRVHGAFHMDPVMYLQPGAVRMGDNPLWDDFV